MPRMVNDLCDQWRFQDISSLLWILWALSLFVVLWKVWLERNRRVFENESSDVEEVVDSIVYAV